MPKNILRNYQLHYQYYSNLLEEIFVTFLVIFALFFANLFTVGVALVAKATRATPTLNSFAKNSAKITRNVTHTAPKFTTI